MILEAVISFLLATGNPVNGVVAVPVSVQYTPTYAPADSTAAQEEIDMQLGGEWTSTTAEPAAKPRKGTVHFRWNKYRYESTYLDNARAAENLRQMLEEIGLEHVDSVVVTAHASPEGVYEHNMWLCRKRAHEFDEVVRREIGLDRDGIQITVRPGGEAWALLRARVADDPNLSEIGRERILKLLDDPKVGWDTKKWRMENGKLGSTKKEGELYRWLLVNHYRYLRSLAVEIYVRDVVVAIDGPVVDVIPEEPTLEPAEPVAEPADTAVAVFEPEPVLTDEVPEPEVIVSVEPEPEPEPKRQYKAIERLDSLIRLPAELEYEHRCKLYRGYEQESSQEEARQAAQRAAELAETADSAETTQAPDSTNVISSEVEKSAPFWPVLGLSTNLLYDATYVPGYGLTSVPSVSLEYYPEDGHYTIGADLEWPNWRHPDEHRYLQVHNVGIWGRYYFKPEEYRFNGLYVSGTLNLAQYGLGWDKKGWEGEAVGISAGIGHKWTFGRIFIDAGLALGFIYGRYDPYVWGDDITGWYYYDYTGDPNEFTKRRMALYWLGPTRLYVSIGIDLFNRNRKRK
ncbi:MAG: DUF3575 domain-containing protein [Bacteroidales bacterium]|nr:DUF3575 domain-containing protein [Bacteroidales bacterium]